jgi:hypothetical protein
MRYLKLFSLKMLNSSSKSEFIASAGAAPMCIDRHLPRRLEDRLRTQALPVLDVERTVHPGNSPVPFHHEYRSRLFRSSVHHSIVLPEWMDLLSTTPEGASDAGVAEFGPEDPWLQLLSPFDLGQIPVEGAERKMPGFPGQVKNQAIEETQCRFYAE